MPVQDGEFDADADLQRLVAALDERVSREGSWIELSQYGGGPDESKMAGNRQGYQRLGIEFLKATLTAPAADSFEVDLEYLISSDSDIRFDWFEISDSLPPAPAESSRPDLPAQLGCLVFFLFAVAAFLVGVATMVKWLIR